MGRQRRSRTVLIVAAVLAGSCSSPRPESVVPGEVDSRTPDATVTTEAALGLQPEIPNLASALVERQRRRHVVPDPMGDLQEQFGIAPVMLPLGEVTTTDLGIEMTLTFERWWRLESAGPAGIALAPPENPLGRLRPNVVFFRPLGFVDPVLAPSGQFLPGDQSIERDQLGNWISALGQVVLLDSEEMMIDGRVVTRYDVDLDPALGPTSDQCSPGNCIDFAWNGASNYFNLRDEEAVSYYEIADPKGPIVVIVAYEEGDSLFGERADRLIRSARFGPSAPHPIPEDTRIANFSTVKAGEWQVSAIPDVRIRFEFYASIAQRPGLVGFGHPVSGFGASVSRLLMNGAEERLVSAEDVLDALGADEQWNVEVGDEIDWFDADGIERSGRVMLVGTDLVEDDPTPPVLLAMLEEGDDPRLPAWPEVADSTLYLVTAVEHGGSARVYAFGTFAADRDPSDPEAISRLVDVGSRLSFD